MNIQRLSLITSLLIVVLLTALLLPNLFAASSARANPSGGLNVVVLCSSCGITGKKDTPHLILLDQNTGEVWAYADLEKQPVSLGQFSKVGLPIQK